MSAKQLAEIDQAIALSGEVIPVALWSVYSKLLIVGFKEEQAMQLTIEYLHATFGKARQ